MRAWQHWGSAFVLLLTIQVARAQEPAPQKAPEKSALDFTHCWGGCNAGTHTDSRAGCPQNVAWFARSSESPAFVGYYVGGGSACRGEPQTVNEGTWGWDYQGRLLPRRVWLAWTHGRRYQGGPGDYRTDGGPKVPDVPGALGLHLHSASDEHK